MTLPKIFTPEWLNAWWQPLIAAIVAVGAGWLAARLLHPLALRLVRHSRVMQAVTERLAGPMKWLLPLIGLQLVWQASPEDLPGIAAVEHLNGVLLIAAVTAVAVGAVQGIAAAVVTLHPQDVADNLTARRIVTQTRVLSRIAVGAVLFAGLAFILMTFPRARQFGASLLASAGVSALVIGIAARSVFGNLLAGLQIALSQPIRIDDVLIVESEWGRVEEITGTYVVMKIWDERRLVIPLQWFIENPFQNWTRSSSQLIGSIFFWVDYTVDLEPLRAEATRIAQTSEDYDGRVCLLQVVDTSEHAMKLRLIVSSPSAGQSWDLCCLVREGVIVFLQRTQPHALPRLRAAIQAPLQRDDPAPQPTDAPALHPARRPARTEAAVNNETGMAGLTAPTGGVVPPPSRPE